MTSSPPLFALVALTLLIGTPAQARPEAAPGPSAGGSPAEVCAALSGSLEVWEDNATWRRTKVRRVVPSAEHWEVWVSGLAAKEPQEASFGNLRVTSVYQEEGGWVARLALTGALKKSCGADTATVRLDHGLGRGRRVVGLHREGLLVASGQELMFLKAEGLEEQPEFELVYQTSFRVETPPTLFIPNLSGRGFRR